MMVSGLSHANGLTCSSIQSQLMAAKQRGRTSLTQSVTCPNTDKAAEDSELDTTTHNLSTRPGSLISFLTSPFLPHGM